MQERSLKVRPFSKRTFGRPAHCTATHTVATGGGVESEAAATSGTPPPTRIGVRYNILHRNRQACDELIEFFMSAGRPIISISKHNLDKFTDIGKIAYR